MIELPDCVEVTHVGDRTRIKSYGVAVSYREEDVLATEELAASVQIITVNGVIDINVDGHIVVAL